MLLYTEHVCLLPDSSTDVAGIQVCSCSHTTNGVLLIPFINSSKKSNTEKHVCTLTQQLCDLIMKSASYFFPVLNTSTQFKLNINYSTKGIWPLLSRLKWLIVSYVNFSQHLSRVSPQQPSFKMSWWDVAARLVCDATGSCCGNKAELWKKNALALIWMLLFVRVPTPPLSARPACASQEPFVCFGLGFSALLAPLAVVAL